MSRERAAWSWAKIARVTIGDRVFIGAGSIILPGVNIGDDVIIGAGSVVTHSIENGKVYAGNPAKEVCSTEDYLAKNRELMSCRPMYDESYTRRGNISAKKKQEQKNALADGGGYVI